MKKECIEYFNDKINKIRFSLNTNVLITYLDHDTLKGGCKNAIGICNKISKEDGTVEYRITIDEYFIETSYKYEINGFNYMKQFLCGETIESVICHEIAHMYIWRHGKKHEELTDRLTKRVMQQIPHGCENSKYLIS